MTIQSNPFAHHPELREQITDPEKSFFRTFTTASLAKLAQERELPFGWWYSDEEREAMRERELTDCWDEDLLVFAYGSLMWDPAIRFSEVRRARVANYARRLILKDIYGGRGTREAPGLMAALDEGRGCDGLVFRISRELVDEETEILWRRERIGPAYKAVFVDAIISGEHAKALTFVADHDAELIDASMRREEQIHYAATGTGFIGTSLDYLRGIDEKFTALGIRDDEVTGLLRDVEAYIASR